MFNAGLCMMTSPLNESNFYRTVNDNNVENHKKDLYTKFIAKYGKDEAALLLAMIRPMCNYEVEIFINYLNNGAQYLQKRFKDGITYYSLHNNSERVCETCYDLAKLFKKFPPKELTQSTQSNIVFDINTKSFSGTNPNQPSTNNPSLVGTNSTKSFFGTNSNQPTVNNNNTTTSSDTPHAIPF